MDRRDEQAIAEFLEAMRATGPAARSPAHSHAPTNKLPSRHSPTRCGTRFEAVRVIAGCSVWGAPTSIPCELPRSSWCESLNLHSFPFWSNERRCGWISRTAAGRTSSSWEWIFRRRAGAEHLGRPGRARARLGAEAAHRISVADHHRTDPPLDQHRPERMQGRRQPRRAVQLRQRLPGVGQGGGCRLGVDTPCLGRYQHASRRPARDGRQARARTGNRQQGQRHPQRVAAGGLDQFAGVAHHAHDARDRPGAEPDRPARPRRIQGGRGSGDPR